MRFLLFLMVFVPSLVFAQLTISPAPVSGNVDLDLASSTFTFVNTTTTPIVMNLALVPKVGFSMPTNRCAGKTLNKNQSCYIIISINDSLLSSGVNITTLNQAGSPLFTLQRTKIQGSGSSIFDLPSISMNDFGNYDITIRNMTPSVKSYSPILSGVDASKYSILLNRCQNVASAKTCKVTLSLSAQSAGVYSATVSEPQITGTMTLSSTITGSTSGAIVTPAEGISVDLASVDFGTITRFGVTGYRRLIITNTGNFGISPIISLNGSMLKTALNRCINIVLPGKSCSLYVYLSIPSSEGNGAKSGLSIDVKSSALATPQSVSIAANLQVIGNAPQLIGSSPMQLVLDVYSVSVGSYHSCALDSNGIARCWGWGAYGKLGSISYANSNPIPLYLRMDLALSGKTIAGIAASGWQTCSLTTDDEVFCQGYNGQGNLGLNTTSNTPNPTQIYMGGVLSGKTIKTMSSGYGSSCAIASDDYVYCWGDAYQGSLGNGFSTTSPGSSSQAIKVNGLIQNIKMKQIARNGYAACALSLDDRLFCWGGHIDSAVPVEVVLPNSEKAKFISIGSALSNNQTCFITQSNKIFCKQYGAPFEIPATGTLIGKTLEKIVSGSGQACVITSDNYGYCFTSSGGTTDMIGLNQAPYNKLIKSIGLGEVHACASTVDNQVYCWGQNSFGQLGDGTTNASSSPVQVNFN
jgi:hypothetical protein